MELATVTSPRIPALHRVLVADDDADIRALIADVLRGDGHQVLEAADGVEVIEQVNSSTLPDLIVADVRMPSVTGLQMLASIHGAQPVPVILITAFGDPDVREHARRLGAIAVLDKPFDLDELRALVKGAIELRAEPRAEGGLRHDEVASIAHDLRTPLSVINLEAEILRGSDSSPAVRRSVERIRSNVGFMEHLVRDLQELAGLADGILEPRRRTLPVRALVETAVERAVSSAERARLRLELETAAIVRVDPTRIERVIANLVRNAINYAPSGSPIHVRVASLGPKVRICVIDGGPGVSPEEAALLFEKYRRGSTARGIPGTGLGLYLCRRIVEAHGGRIGVESATGTGSTFFFELPVA
jgi:signal transduction histidine kinase